MALVSKVELLRRIAAKIAGENVCTPNDDTVCEALEKILINLPDGGASHSTVEFEISHDGNGNVSVSATV